MPITNDPIPPVMQMLVNASDPNLPYYIIERYEDLLSTYEFVASFSTLEEALTKYPKIFNETEGQYKRDLKPGEGYYRIRRYISEVVAVSR